MKRNGIRWWLIVLPIILTVAAILIAKEVKKEKTESTPSISTRQYTCN